MSPDAEPAAQLPKSFRKWYAHEVLVRSSGRGRTRALVTDVEVRTIEGHHRVLLRLLTAAGLRTSCYADEVAEDHGEVISLRAFLEDRQRPA